MDVADFGILTAGSKRGAPGGNRANFIRLCRAADRCGLRVAVLNVDPDDTSLQTFAYDPRDRNLLELNRLRERSIPKVLYNRIPTRRLERRSRISRCIDEWTKAGVVITNPRFLRKDELAELWQRDAVLRPFVPETLLLHTPDDVQRLLDGGAIYLKPIDGRAGAGIVRVRRTGRGYETIRQHPGFAWREVVDERTLVRWLARNVNRLVVQREVAAARWQGRKFDLRMLLHANPRSGHFSITGAGVRAGQPGAITTHVPNGGIRADPLSVLSAVFGRVGARRVMRRAEEIAELAAGCVAAGLSGTWSELSLDVGLTPDGEPCLFEANSKPMKFDESTIERQAKQRLVAFLAAQGPRGAVLPGCAPRSGLV